MQNMEKLWEMRKTIKIFKVITTERRRNYSVSEPNYYSTKFFTKHLLATEMKKTDNYK